VDAINRRDPDTLVSLYAVDGTFEDPAGTKQIAGEAALRDLYEWVARLDVRFEMISVHPVGDRFVAFRFDVFQKIGAENEPGAARVAFDASGEVRQEVIDVFELDVDGKITRARAYWGYSNVHSVNLEAAGGA